MIYTRSLEPPTRATNGMTFKLSTPGRKRDGLELNMQNFRLNNFTRNPVMLWQHGMDPNRGSIPIGRWEDVRMSDDGLTARAVFDTEDEFAAAIQSKFERGFLSAVSIGWLPEMDDKGRAKAYDLLEASAVAVPADPQALAEGRSVVLTTSELSGLVSRLERVENELRDARIKAALTGIL